MKYLKSYNLFENAHDLFRNEINYDLIQDLKDVALDYIDDGYKLIYYVSIYDRKSNKYVHLFTGEFSHDIDGIHSNDSDIFFNIKVTNYLKNLKSSFKYEIVLKSDKYMYPNIVEERFIEQIAKMYPNEEIKKGNT
jgi:hypothetical protein